MTSRTVHCNRVAGISDLKANPEKLVASTEGEALVILSYNKPVFYCVPLDLFERMKSALDAQEARSVEETK